MSNGCLELERIQRFTSVGQDGGIRELCELEKEEYNEIYNELISMYEEKGGKITKDAEIQVINKFTTSNDECISPKGLVNVSLEYLAKLLTFANTAGIQWEVNVEQNTHTHFRNLYNFNVKLKCLKREFVDMAIGKGFRCPG
ncbi:hypothetical protein [Desulfitobacterium sp. AusDCA]|uniref:hypothetical protein n=1 Tax=Desulfitobacterium sp. AusDCA TaxID=3240383 RepID=UPI003DA772A7